MTDFLAWLQQPTVRAGLSIAFAWLVPYVLRRWFPGAWRRIAAIGPADGTAAHVFQSLPSVLAGALMTALTSGGDPWRDTWMAGLAVVAPLLHHAAKASPIPYTGAVRDEQ
jgi:hypothetical protein